MCLIWLELYLNKGGGTAPGNVGSQIGHLYVNDTSNAHTSSLCFEALLCSSHTCPQTPNIKFDYYTFYSNPPTSSFYLRKSPMLSLLSAPFHKEGKKQKKRDDKRRNDTVKKRAQLPKQIFSDKRNQNTSEKEQDKLLLSTQKQKQALGLWFPGDSTGAKESAEECIKTRSQSEEGKKVFARMIIRPAGFECELHASYNESVTNDVHVCFIVNMLRVNASFG